MFKRLRLGAAAARVAEEKLFELALAELGRGERRDGLWAKALSDSEGNKDKTQAVYLRLRVQAMKDDSALMEAISDESQSQAVGQSQRETAQAGHKGYCEVCRTNVTINYGDAYKTLCLQCS